uniref:Uncharacterized protein n=1 Tax=Pararge aegeria TaxID=116150 RepID=S4PE35_9NEOP
MCVYIFHLVRTSGIKAHLNVASFLYFCNNVLIAKEDAAVRCGALYVDTASYDKNCSIDVKIACYVDLFISK